MFDLLDSITIKIKKILSYTVPTAYFVISYVLYKMNSPAAMAFVIFAPFLYVGFVKLFNTISFECDHSIGFSLGFISLLVCYFLGNASLGGVFLAVFMLLGFTKFYSFLNKLF
ncbi:hypothetical protein [Pseudomonas aeruginosa]|uniref:hypothetical protein n=1 Tax=Pseudomonas aeruginosa TaxID=287 RepID=UPI001052E5E2|nr:hypothetical protein [Pseudomonas aeruginosa]